MLKKLKGLDGTSYLLLAALILSFIGRVFDIAVVKVDITVSYILFSAFIIISIISLIYANIKKYRYVSEFFYFTGLCYLTFYAINVDLTYVKTFTQFFLVVMLLRFERNNFIFLHLLSILMVFLLTYICYHKNYFTYSEAIDHFLRTLCEWVFTLIVHKKIYKNQIDQIEEMTPLVSIGRSTSFLLHEIQGPLKLLERDLSSKNGTNQHIQEIKRLLEVSSSYANNTVNHTISMVDVELLIEKTLELYHSQIKFLDIDIIKNYRETELQTDKTCLSIVLKNLIKNSLEAAIEYPGKPSSTITTFANKQSFYITIENPTINKESILNRVFTPGFTTKKGGANMGHGLYLSKKLIEDLNGTIKVEIVNEIFKVEVSIPLKR
jgi:signal transduction histidine kinase